MVRINVGSVGRRCLPTPLASLAARAPGTLFFFFSVLFAALLGLTARTKLFYPVSYIIRFAV